MITNLVAGMGGVLSQAPAAAVGYTFKDPLAGVTASSKAGSKATEQQPLDSCLPLLIPPHTAVSSVTVGHLVTSMHTFYDAHMPEYKELPPQVGLWFS